MNEVKLDVTNWVMEVVGGLLVALGVGGLTMFGKAKTLIEARITLLEGGHGAQATQLAVLQECQEHTRERLEEIRETTRDMNEKIDQLVQSALDRRSGGQRRTDHE